MATWDGRNCQSFETATIGEPGFSRLNMELVFVICYYYMEVTVMFDHVTCVDVW